MDGVMADRALDLFRYCNKSKIRHSPVNINVFA